MIDQLSQFLVSLETEIRAKGVDLTEQELQLAIAQITAGATMLTLVPDIFEKSFGLNMCDEEVRQEYLHRLMDKLL